MKKTLSCVFVLLLAIGTLGGCGLIQFGPSPPKQTYEDLSRTELRCLVLPESKREYIIRNEAQYSALFEAPQQIFSHPECKDLTKEPPVDLATHTILGVLVRGGGCRSQVDRFVHRDEKEHRLTFQVVLYTFGECKRVILHPVWVAVERIPEEYRILFLTEEKHFEK